MLKYDLHKYPRLYVNVTFAQGVCVDLNAKQNHYIRNVLRKQRGDYLRVFNGRDGEWIARIVRLGKRNVGAVLEECVRIQTSSGERFSGNKHKRSIHLYFSPIKKQRMDMLIEKAVELGVNTLHPVIMHRTVSRKINEDRISAQIIEAAEQCERMDIPTVEPIVSLGEVITSLSQPLFACIERSSKARHITDCKFGDRAAFLVGPEGGFNDAEIALINSCEKITTISLGSNILRAETASIACLFWASVSF